MGIFCKRETGRFFSIEAELCGERGIRLFRKRGIGLFCKRGIKLLCKRGIKLFCKRETGQGAFDK